LEAAKRQLAVATELYFQDQDAAAIHTLVAASYNIIRDLSRLKGGAIMAVKDFFPTTVSASKADGVSRWVNSFENFLKHADRDPDGEIELSPDLTEAMLIDAWAQFERLGGQLPKAGKIFKLWTGKIKDDAAPQITLLVQQFKQLDKAEFYTTTSKLVS
jgi:hypothetical protein